MSVSNITKLNKSYILKIGEEEATLLEIILRILFYINS